LTRRNPNLWRNNYSSNGWWVWESKHSLSQGVEFHGV
jgi:hypothetical protein